MNSKDLCIPPLFNRMLQVSPEPSWAINDVSDSNNDQYMWHYQWHYGKTWSSHQLLALMHLNPQPRQKTQLVLVFHLGRGLQYNMHEAALPAQRTICPWVKIRTQFGKVVTPEKPWFVAKGMLSRGNQWRYSNFGELLLVVMWFALNLCPGQGMPGRMPTYLHYKIRCHGNLLYVLFKPWDQNSFSTQRTQDFWNS